jgi:hypothetical protein
MVIRLARFWGCEDRTWRTKLAVSWILNAEIDIEAEN